MTELIYAMSLASDCSFIYFLDSVDSEPTQLQHFAKIITSESFQIEGCLGEHLGTRDQGKKGTKVRKRPR